MKIDNKKKKIIIIAAVIILVAAIATTVGILCSKKAKQSENTESQTVTVDVTDENGEIVTDENGDAVTEVEPQPIQVKRLTAIKRAAVKKTIILIRKTITTIPKPQNRQRNIPQKVQWTQIPDMIRC